jgi:hypothetical protein
VGFSGDTGVATSAQLNNCKGLWLTTVGDLYIADDGNNRIRKVRISDGIITTVAGSSLVGSFSGDGGFATSATLNSPTGVFMDSVGKLFIADKSNFRIRVVDTNNIITTFAGTGILNPFNGDNLPAILANITPCDVKGDSLGNIYLADIGRNLIRLIDQYGIIVPLFGTPDSVGFTTGTADRLGVLNSPVGLWVDSVGSVYFSDMNSIHRGILVTSPTSQPSTQPTRLPSSQPSGQPSCLPSSRPTLPDVSANLFMKLVAGSSFASSSGDNGPATSAFIMSFYPWVDTNGNIYVPDEYGHTIRKVTASNQLITTFGGNGTHSSAGISRPISLANFDFPMSIVGDLAGTVLYFSDQLYVWRYLLSSGIISVYAGRDSKTFGGDSGLATSAYIYTPKGLWLTINILYFADCGNHRIRIVLPNGIITTVAGSGLGSPTFTGDNDFATSATLYFPAGVYVDTVGKQFIADTENHRIRLVDTNNIITTFAGTGTVAYNDDNIPASLANLNGPRDVKGDSLGNIFVSDYEHCVVRRIDTNGIISILFGTQGSCGFTSGLASRFSLINRPVGLWVDTVGMVYVSDYNSIHQGTLVSSPTSQPSGHPSRQPSGLPTGQPTSQPSPRPTGQPSSQPISRPTAQPTAQSTSQPSSQPSRRPSTQPSRRPTSQPSRSPTAQPSAQPTRQPTVQPTNSPSAQPSVRPSAQPSERPTEHPSGRPSSFPSAQPSPRPSEQPFSHPSSPPSRQPTERPTSQPSTQPTGKPSNQPSVIPLGHPSSDPTSQPSIVPSCQPTSQPTDSPTNHPSIRPTDVPTSQPTSRPSGLPTLLPTGQPTGCPSSRPTDQPSFQPSREPTSLPSVVPSILPTGQPTGRPTTPPTQLPSSQPSGCPSIVPSILPTSCPSVFVTEQPSGQPSSVSSSSSSSYPSQSPSILPTSQPTIRPTGQPSLQPISCPSSGPTVFPTSQPTLAPFVNPSSQPTSRPTDLPTSDPSKEQLPSTSSVTPSVFHSLQPSFRPTVLPSNQPLSVPSVVPTRFPAYQPSSQPSSKPSFVPRSAPSSQPTRQPTSQPSRQPFSRPTTQPTACPSSQPSGQPSSSPSSSCPTRRPTSASTAPQAQSISFYPTTTKRPSRSPTRRPTVTPTLAPTNFFSVFSSNGRHFQGNLFLLGASSSDMGDDITIVDNIHLDNHVPNHDSYIFSLDTTRNSLTTLIYDPTLLLYRE